MNDIFVENALLAWPGIEIQKPGHFTGSTDMGDLSHLMPVIHPYIGGVTGSLHGRDFAVVDFNAAVLLPAKALAMSVIDYLWDGAREAKNIISTCKPLLTQEQYTATMEKYFSNL
jgi:metal-dependent amidase/aminoacylase/carboxypeptidase family protein